MQKMEAVLRKAIKNVDSTLDIVINRVYGEKKSAGFKIVDENMEKVASIDLSVRVEVVTIMMSLFDDEQIMRTYTKDIEKETERKSAERMIKDGELSLEKIARYVPALSMEELKEIEAEVMQLA